MAVCTCAPVRGGHALKRSVLCRCAPFLSLQLLASMGAYYKCRLNGPGLQFHMSPRAYLLTTPVNEHGQVRVRRDEAEDSLHFAVSCRPDGYEVWKWVFLWRFRWWSPPRRGPARLLGYGALSCSSQILQALLQMHQPQMESVFSYPSW